MSTTVHDTQLIIEHARPRRLKVTDTRYGLKTAAKQAHDDENRAAFMAARRDGLSKQRTLIEGRLASLRKDVRKIVAEVQTGKREASQDVLDKVARLRSLEIKLLDDITRIDGKIAAAV